MSSAKLKRLWHSMVQRVHKNLVIIQFCILFQGKIFKRNYVTVWCWCVCFWNLNVFIYLLSFIYYIAGKPNQNIQVEKQRNKFIVVNSCIWKKTQGMINSSTRWPLTSIDIKTSYNWDSEILNIVTIFCGLI